MELNRELEGLKNDKALYEVELENERKKYAEMLRNDLGKDINDVLHGKIKVKLTFKEKLKYFINMIFDKF